MSQLMIHIVRDKTQSKLKNKELKLRRAQIIIKMKFFQLLTQMAIYSLTARLMRLVSLAIWYLLEVFRSFHLISQLNYHKEIRSRHWLRFNGINPLYIWILRTYWDNQVICKQTDVTQLDLQIAYWTES